MNYPWLDEYCLSMKGASKDFKEEWNATRYLVGEKMFAMLAGDKYDKPIITLKLDPPFGEIVRGQFEDIVPGYYMNKQHWNSVYLEGQVPDDILRSLVLQSYEIVFGSLSKKKQAEIIQVSGDNRIS